MTSSFIERRPAHPGRRSRARGAVFVEAVVVISALTLGLLALDYVRDLYLKKLGVSRLARAAVIAHSMAGCKSNQPADWLGRDLADYTTQGANADQQSARGTDGGSISATSSPRAQGLMQRAGAGSSDGEGLLNPITDAELGGEARAGRRSSPAQFFGRVNARSFVSCGDEIKDGSFDRLLGVMKDEFSNLLGR
jgi:hypothetical protein